MPRRRCYAQIQTGLAGTNRLYDLKALNAGVVMPVSRDLKLLIALNEP